MAQTNEYVEAGDQVPDGIYFEAESARTRIEASAREMRVRIDRLIRRPVAIGDDALNASDVLAQNIRGQGESTCYAVIEPNCLQDLRGQFAFGPRQYVSGKYAISVPLIPDIHVR